MIKGVIVKAISGFYYVSCLDTIFECKARGNFRNAGISPLVGDKCEISVIDEQNRKGVIDSICERKNMLSRPAVANIDKLFIVSSYKTPSPDLFMIDRLSAIAYFNGIEPIVVFNKCDIGDFDEYLNIYKSSNIKCYVVSAKEKIGINNLFSEIKDSICAFAGNSGVGKSSIINSLFPELSLKTGEVSEKLGRGKHTTRHTELFSVQNGFVVDTPGFASLESENSIEFKESLPDCFPDFKDYLTGCRFNSCTHTCEPGCSLIDAVNGGFIQKTRYNSFVKLFNELKDLKQWQK